MGEKARLSVRLHTARTRRALFAGGVPLGLIAVVLVATAVWLSGRPVQGTAGLLAQEGVLIAAFQALLGFAVAVATIYYAMRTSDMVRAMEVSQRVEQDRQLTGAVSNLVGAVLAVTTSSGAIAELAGSKHRLLPMTRRRERLVTPLVMQSMTELANALRWAQDVSAAEPTLRDQTRELIDTAVEASSDALAGEPARVAQHARRTRELVDALYATRRIGRYEPDVSEGRTRARESRPNPEATSA